MKKIWMPMAALVLALTAGCGGGGSDAPAGTAGSSSTLASSPSTTGAPAADAGTAPGATAAPSTSASGAVSADAGTASTNAAALPPVSPSVPEASGGAAVTPATPVVASATTTTAATVPPAGTVAPAAPVPASAPSMPSAPAPTPAPAKGATPSSPPAPTPYDLLVDQAEAKRKEVETLAVDGPCETDDQCGTLTLEPAYLWPIAVPQWLDYSLVSPTANAAFAAAAEYNQLALQAQALAPPNNAMCACFINASPTVLRCVARKCVRTQPWFEPIVEPAAEAQPAKRRR